jgi:hypothetical protein
MDYPISARYSPDWERYPLPKLLKSGPKEVPAKDLHPFDFLTAHDKRSTDWIARVQREAQRLV